MIKGLLHHLPDVVRPPDTVCYAIEVPNDPWYLRAFVGTFFELASARSWDNDEAHTALQVAQVWLEIALALKPGCSNGSGAGDSGGDMPRLRQNPDNPCLLEQECLPDQWVTLFDASLCVQANTGQPSPGGDGPGPGQTQQFCLKLSGNGKVLLPIAVQGGWTLTLTNKTGGWTDGGGDWNCPNGQSYIGGLCFGVGGLDGGDPLPTALHASIIAEIDTLFYDGNALITVPPGLVDQQVVFQMNDASLSDNYGDVGFCVQVTRPTAAPLSIAYSTGSGPASAVPGNIIDVTLGNEGTDWRVVMAFSSCVKISIVGATGWQGPSSSNNYVYDDCASVAHPGPGSMNNPVTDFPAHTCVTSLNTACIAGGSGVVLQIKIEDFC